MRKNELKMRKITIQTTDSECPNCYATEERIMENQPDFLEQRSLVQEVIEEAGHLCIVLPKFHCELNFIEFFWGTVKRYLRECCDMSFDTLKINLPHTMESVPPMFLSILSGSRNIACTGGWRLMGRVWTLVIPRQRLKLLV